MVFLQGCDDDSDNASSESASGDVADPDYQDDDPRPHFPNQNELNDLIRDLGLPKSGAELLTSRLMEWNLLGEDCQITMQRNRHLEFAKYFAVDGSLCFCSDVTGLFHAIGIEYDSSGWRLFIDSSTRSLKAVLLHNGNIYPSIPVAHSTQMKEDYDNVRNLLAHIDYNKYRWDICGDYKMIGFLLGMQGGFTKYSCFLCLWDSRAASEHYNRAEWPARETLEPGSHNVVREALVDRSKVLLPPLHTKLGLIKQFVTALDPGGETYQQIRIMFPKLTEAKISGGIFVGPQVRKMLASERLEQTMSGLEMQAWKSFRAVVNGFLGNNKEPNYKELVSNMIKAYQKMGCRMSPKMHYLHSHIDFFHGNLGSTSEEHGERFHQDIMRMEQRYQGHWDSAMMGDYIWSIVRRDGSGHKRKCRSSQHF